MGCRASVNEDWTRPPVLNRLRLEVCVTILLATLPPNLSGTYSIAAVRGTVRPSIRLEVCVCVYSNSRNDIPRVAQLYGTIAAHTQRHASVLVVSSVLRAHVQFCRFDKADATADVQ